ncbi:glycerophosphodiester phosphodiesterase family protein [Sporosarcina soli]|uniref:Glycerophosphodiester phosphodiesterase family protein n=1 Tax=Sporosarcina soli TaxID=334736 RepID=A0ABW0TIV4_9BACL
MKKIMISLLIFILYGCTQPTVRPVDLPMEDVLVIAHRGASAYAPAHTIAAYEMAVEMGADYIELDLHMTNDGKLVAVHDPVVSFQTATRAIADITLDELLLYSPGEVFNKENPQYASDKYEVERIVELKDIFQHFSMSTNYYIEIKSPDQYPGIEEELIRQLQAHHLLDTNDQPPKVIIQSFHADSLQKVFQLEPTIPLIQLVRFEKEASFTKKELKRLKNYASGVGVNWDAITPAFIETMHKEGMDVHAFTVNEEETIRLLLTLGVDGIFTDKPDLVILLRDEAYRPDFD